MLIALAVATMLSGGGTSLLQSIFSFGALIALGVGVFRIRKADMEAGMAAAPAAGGGVIDAEATEAGDVAPKSLLQRLLGPGRTVVAAPAARSPPPRPTSLTTDVLDVDVVDGDADTALAPEDAHTPDDPLTQLEAELAAEAEEEAGPRQRSGGRHLSGRPPSAQRVTRPDLRPAAVRVRALVSGRVQGVWYRESCRREADRSG